MRRLRPPKFLSNRNQLSLTSFVLAGVLCTISSAELPLLALKPPAAPTRSDWTAVGLSEVDAELNGVVAAPHPAAVPSDGSSDVTIASSPQEVRAPGGEAAEADNSVQEVFPELADDDTDAGRIASRNESSTKAETPNVEEPSVATTETVAPVIPSEVAALKVPIEDCLTQHSRIRLNSGRDSCWSMMHGFLGWGSGYEIHIGSPRGPRTNAIAWLAQNQPCGGRQLFYLDGNRLRGREGPGYQGHPAQFLAMLAQCNVDPSYPIRVNGRDFTVSDLIDEEKRTCSTSRELTFKLLGLVHYLGTEATWAANDGSRWDLPRLVAWELGQPVNGAACGGTHRIMALSFAVEKRKQDGGEMSGHWWRAEKYISDYHQYTMSLQNRDGSFSSDWFRSRADWGDMERGVQTTGHILEWLAFSLPQESLYDPRMVKSVSYLTDTLRRHPQHSWPVGPKGHAIRALRMYYERVYQPVANTELPLAHRRSSEAATTTR